MSKDKIYPEDLIHYYSTPDLHRARAAHEFGCLEYEVNKEMRRAAKYENYRLMYSEEGYLP